MLFNVLSIVSFIAIQYGCYQFVFKEMKQPRLRHFLPQLALVIVISVSLMRLLPQFNFEQMVGFLPAKRLKLATFVFVVISVLWVFLTAYVRRYAHITQRATKLALKWRIVSYIVCLLSVVLIAFPLWFRSFFGQLSPEQFIYNLQSPVVGTADSMSNEILLTPLFIIVFFGIVFFYLHFYANKITFSNRSKQWTMKKGVLATASFFVVSVVFAVVLLRLDSVYRAYFIDDDFIENHYVDIRQLNPVFPERKRNLIHIYMESVENSYFSREQGGHMKQGLMDELAQLTKEGVHWSHHDQFGGPHQTHGSGWSVAAMINMMSGIPLKIATNGKAYGLEGEFLPGIYNLGDLLHDNGYEQTIMFGADADFGGLTTYFTTHGKFNIFDVKYAREKGLIPKDYNVWWGYEDEKLYEYAKMEITRLASTGKPFHFSMENADTHFPDGYITDKTPRRFDSQYANVIAHSQQEVVKLVRWIQSQPFYDNTTLVITGDHLSMDKKFFETFDPKFRRSIYNVILNAPVKASKTTHRQYAPLDFYPTILASMGIQYDGNRVGLGTNLFSDEQTLIEKIGVDQFNEGLEKNSLFYARKFLTK